MNSSIQCPQCGFAISGATAPGQTPSITLRCEKCGNEVLNPSATANSAVDDDDDWLNLDDTSVPAPADTVSSAPTSIPVEVPTEPTAHNETAPSDALQVDGVEIVEVDDDEIGMLSGLPAAPPAGNKPVDTEFRLRCTVCDSVMFVLPAQEGSVVECSDCRSEIVVPAPPKPKKPKPTFSAGPASFDTNIPPSIPFATPSPTAVRPEDPFRKNASELLEEASLVEIDEPDDDFTVPSVTEWLSGVFKVMTDIGVIAHLAIFSVAGSAAGMLALWTQHPAMVLFMFPAGAIFGLVVLSSAFAILQSSANDSENVDDWPTSDASVWFENAFCTAAATVISGLPAFLFTTFIFGTNLASVALTMFSIFAFFPFVLLSILDHNSVTMPFSAEVARSFQTTKEPWGGMYFSSAMLFAGLFFLFIIMGMASPIAATPVVVTATVASVFIYFAMIGRLAFSIGQAVREEEIATESGE